MKATTFFLIIALLCTIGGSVVLFGSNSFLWIPILLLGRKAINAYESFTEYAKTNKEEK